MKTLLTGYRVGNLSRSLAFYRNVGFQEVGRVALEDGAILVMLHLPGDGDVVTIELVYDPAVGPIAIGNGFSHIAVQVDDLAATLADLDARGVAHPGIERPAGEAGPAVCNLPDPDGYPIELVEWPPGHPDDMTSADFRVVSRTSGLDDDSPARPAPQLEGDEAMDQPSTDNMLRELNRFVGEWIMQAAPPDGLPWPGEVRVRFEWLDGHAFLVERWILDRSEAPEGTPTSGTSIFGCDAAHGTYVQLHYDNRGVCRVYEMGLRAGKWTLRRDGPPFAQRFTATFAVDGKIITGRWEIAEEDQDWRTDFDVTYTRVG